MPNILIRDVPDDLHAQLTSRAESRGQSLQRFALALLRDGVERSAIEEALTRWESNSGDHAYPSDIVETLKAAREERDDDLREALDDARR